MNQVIAIEKGVKSVSYKEFSEIHKKLQKSALLGGLARRYRPTSDEGEIMPPESQKVQVLVTDALQEAKAALLDLFNITATKDYGNCEARADIVVGGQTLAEAVPVTHLLFLDKQLVDLRTFVQKLPTLDPSETWHLDEASDCWASETVETTRVKKILRNHEKAPATEHHPAQVEVYKEDLIVGYWKTTKFSGALPARQVTELLGKVDKLQKAVKFAREEANSKEVQRSTIGDSILGYLFG